jgi:tripartite-type tricarboxylate transporter receptor subunit TctC
MINRRMLTCALALMMISAGSVAATSVRAEYPTRVIKIVIPNPPGGPGDVIARAFADRATKTLGQPLVFEYKAGASTTIGTQAVAKAEPDGYTILGFPSSGLAVSLLRDDMPYNIESDLKPVIGMGSIPMALVVRADSQIKSINDLTTALRKGDLRYGTAGLGTLAHLSTVALLNELKGTATHVPFRGNPEVMQAVMGGHIDFFFASVGDAAAVAGANTVRVLGVTAAERVPELPDVPTMNQLGFPTFNPKLWYAIMAPGKTPDEIVTRLFSAFAEAAKDPTVQKQLSVLGFTVEVRDTKGVSEMMKEEAARWSKVIADNNIKPSK